MASAQRGPGGESMRSLSFSKPVTNSHPAGGGISAENLNTEFCCQEVLVFSFHCLVYYKVTIQNLTVANTYVLVLSICQVPQCCSRP